MGKVIVAFIPVLHEGYKRFFDKNSDARILYILGPEIITKFDYLKKEIRALDPVLLKKAIESWSIFDEVHVANAGSIKEIQALDSEIIMPDEDVTRELARKYFYDKKTIFDNIFLRWDKHKAMEKKPVEADQKISVKEFDKKIIEKLYKEAERSS